jgi:hypothetical protein
MAFWSRITSLIAGGAVARAAADGAAPVLEPVRQHAWQRNQLRVLDPEIAARLVAQAIISEAEAEHESGRSGVGPNRLKALVKLVTTMPGQADLDKMLNRRTIDRDLFNEAMAKHQTDPRFWDALYDLTNDKLTPDQLAVMIQRTVVENPGILPNQPSTDGSNVPPMPLVELDVLKEAAAGGIDKSRLAAMARIIGLPASPDLAARMHYRGIITEGAFNQAILEGNTRGEWAPFLLKAFRAIPTAEQFVEGHLRGWITRDEMYAGTARHGMSKADTDLEFQIHRRPLTPHQIKQALARGASFNPAPDEIQNPLSAAAHQNNLGPEWYELYESLAGSYPSLFITNRLVTSGIVAPADGRDWLRKAGNADEVVEAMHKSWTAASSSSAADPHVAKAQTRLYGTLHGVYMAERVDDADALVALETAGVAAAARQQVLDVWAVERELRRKTLTPAQIKKAVAGGEYTRQQALDRLQELGYSLVDAQTFLDE